MIRERALKVVSVVEGLLFVRALYPLLTLRQQARMRDARITGRHNSRDV
jgi:hypothetical protein